MNVTSEGSRHNPVSAGFASWLSYTLVVPSPYQVRTKSVPSPLINGLGTDLSAFLYLLGTKEA